MRFRALPDIASSKKRVTSEFAFPERVVSITVCTGIFRCFASSWRANLFRPIIDVADILCIYLDDCGERVTDRAKLERSIARLNDFWGGKILCDVTTVRLKAE